MDKCVLDTSVLIKSIFKPARSLSDENYEREMATHKKCTYIIKTIEENDMDTYIPYVCIPDLTVKKSHSSSMSTILAGKSI